VFHEFGDDACGLLRGDEDDASLECVASASAFEDDVQVCPEPVGDPAAEVVGRIGISTLRFSVSSFLALFGSSLLHLYMDSEDPDELTQ